VAELAWASKIYRCRQVVSLGTMDPKAGQVAEECVRKWWQPTFSWTANLHVPTEAARLLESPTSPEGLNISEKAAMSITKNHITMLTPIAGIL